MFNNIYRILWHSCTTIMVVSLFINIAEVKASYFDSVYETLETGVTKCAQAVKVDKIIQDQLLPGTWCLYDKNVAVFDGSKVELSCLDGVILDGEYIEKQPGGLAVVLFHGNGNSYENWHGLKFFTDRKINILAFSIRGYGNSQGTRDEIAYSSALDIEAALRFLIQEKNIPKENIMSYGKSLGGGYATYAARYFGIPPVLDHTFTNIGS